MSEFVIGADVCRERVRHGRSLADELQQCITATRWVAALEYGNQERRMLFRIRCDALTAWRCCCSDGQRPFELVRMLPSAFCSPGPWQGYTAQATVT